MNLEDAGLTGRTWHEGELKLKNTVSIPFELATIKQGQPDEKPTIVLKDCSLAAGTIQHGEAIVSYSAKKNNDGEWEVAIHNSDELSDEQRRFYTSLISRVISAPEP